MDDLPALYWVTLCCVCLRHFLPLQNVRRSLGKLTLGACVWECEGGEAREAWRRAWERARTARR